MLTITIPFLLLLLLIDSGFFLLNCSESLVLTSYKVINGLSLSNVGANHLVPPVRC